MRIILSSYKFIHIAWLDTNPQQSLCCELQHLVAVFRFAVRIRCELYMGRILRHR